MAFTAAQRRKAKETIAAKALAKQQEVLPDFARLTEQQARDVISHVAEHGDLIAAARSLGAIGRGLGVSDVILFLRSKQEWVNGMEVAEATYAKKLSRDAVDVANEPIPWGEIGGMEIEAQKLFACAVNGSIATGK